VWEPALKDEQAVINAAVKAEPGGAMSQQRCKQGPLYAAGGGRQPASTPSFSLARSARVAVASRRMLLPRVLCACIHGLLVQCPTPNAYTPSDVKNGPNRGVE
jgi:hypothetical protein